LCGLGFTQTRDILVLRLSIKRALVVLCASLLASRHAGSCISPIDVSVEAMAHMWKSAWAKTTHGHTQQSSKSARTRQQDSAFPPTDPLAPSTTPEPPASPELSTSKRRSLFKPLSFTPRSSIDVVSAELGIEMANMPASPERTSDERAQFPWIPTSSRRRDSEENSLRSQLSRRSTEL
jgi:hypothetical protein